MQMMTIVMHESESYWGQHLALKFQALDQQHNMISMSCLVCLLSHSLHSYASSCQSRPNLDQQHAPMMRLAVCKFIRCTGQAQRRRTVTCSVPSCWPSPEKKRAVLSALAVTSCTLFGLCAGSGCHAMPANITCRLYNLHEYC